MTISDPQKEILYSFENEWRDWNVNNLSLTKCRAVIRQACKEFKVPPPKVRQHQTMAYSWHSKDVISLQAKGGKTPVPGETVGGKNRAISLHEAAHHIADHFFKNRIADHGPTFLGIYMWLLIEWKVAPASALHASARKAGLRWREITPISVRAVARNP